MKEQAYSGLATLAEQPHSPLPGVPGRSLYRIGSYIRWYILVIAIYAVAAFAMALYVSQCDQKSVGVKVLPTGDSKVDQFRSGIALSFLLMPVALSIRKVSTELAFMHPFALSSVKPVALTDLDLMMDPGFESMLHLFKYSTLVGIVQGALLAAGALIVPIGTLLVFTGDFAAPNHGTSLAGMPSTGGGGSGYLWQDMHDKNPMTNSSLNFLVATSKVKFEGDVLANPGTLPEIASQIGPTRTTSSFLNYLEGVRYDGIVMLNWTSGCDVTDAIRVSGIYTDGKGKRPSVNITYPGGGDPIIQQMDEASGPFLFAANESTSQNNVTVYYALGGFVSQTSNLDEAKKANAITVSNQIWFQTIACTPTLVWQTSNCVWNSSVMTDCHPSPGTNNSKIDGAGLDLLPPYLSALPASMAESQSADSFFGYSPIQVALQYNRGLNDQSINYRAPLIQDYDKLYGHVAQSVVTLVMSGVYGANNVTTIGSTPKQVYLVRSYILGLVVAILAAITALTIFLLRWNTQHRIPLRKATFLTISNAVRGRKWDEAFAGGCIVPESELKERFKGFKVMYGVDEQIPGYVGFAHEVTPIKDDEIYGGAL